MRPSCTPANVSWLIPVRDGRRWIAGAVTSVLSDAREDDEVIVVDDGSTDTPSDVLPTDPRIRLIEQAPLGIAAALETGRRNCRWPFIARLDADDECLPGRRDAQVEMLLKNPSLAAVGGRAELIGATKDVPRGMDVYVDWVNRQRDPHPQLLVESPLFHPATLLRAEAVEKVGGYRDGDFPEDYDLWLRLSGAGWRLENLDRAVVRIRDRPDRLTRTDPRYRREAFRRLKMEWIAEHLLPAHRRIAIWGTGRTGRPWIRWILGKAEQPPTLVDVNHGGTRQGIPILPPEHLESADVDLLLVAVGVRGARALIRERISSLRPGWREGVDWFAVA